MTTTRTDGAITTGHPADAIDETDAAVRFWWSLTGGSHWDELLVAMKPECANCGSEHAQYTIDACFDEGLTTDDELDAQSEEGRRVLRLWCDSRARTCAEILRALPVVDGHVRAHRLIACDPADLRADLGLFWTHAFEDWPDPYAPWGVGGREAPTLVIEAMVPVEAVDWQVSCMALMDWYCGDSESELRLKPGFPVHLVSCTRLDDGSFDPVEPVVVPDLAWRT
jgi:hypothetical protein